MRLKLEMLREGIPAEAYVNERDKTILPTEQARKKPTPVAFTRQNPSALKSRQKPRPAIS